MRKIILIFTCAIICICCGNSISQTDNIVKFDNIVEQSFSELPKSVLMGINFIPISTDSMDYVFTTPNKVIVNGEKIYVNDFMSRKLFVYSYDGTPISVLHKTGRGTGEYLQITDFDVASNGDIWIVDGQADKVMRYSSDGDFVSDCNLPFQADYIKCLDNDLLMFSVAEWETGKYKGCHLIVTDENLNVKKELVAKTENRDRNFRLVPCAGLQSENGTLCFHKPISDNVHCIDLDNYSEEIYCFDFGSRKVPEQARIDTEPYMEDFQQYTTLSTSVYIDDDIIAGGLIDNMQMLSFIIDRNDNIKYIQNEPFSCLMFLGISNGNMIYMYKPGSSDFPPYMPDAVKEHIKNDGYVVAVLPLEKVHRSLKS